jgi:hypothetical protein
VIIVRFPEDASIEENGPGESPNIVTIKVPRPDGETWYYIDKSWVEES